MAVITVTAPPPYGAIPVNTDMIYAVVPDDISDGSKLLIDTAGGRSVSAIDDVDAIAGLVGTAFARFKWAGLQSGYVLLNRIGWVSIVSHPQVKGVTQVNYKNHYIPVKASVDAVTVALS